MAEEREKAAGKELTHEDSLGPAKKMIDEGIARIDKLIEQTQDACNGQPDTNGGDVQRQIGQLSIMVLLREKQFWEVYASIIHLIFLVQDELHKSVASRATRDQLREESARIVEELLQSVQKSKPPTLTHYVA